MINQFNRGTTLPLVRERIEAAFSPPDVEWAICGKDEAEEYRCAPETTGLKHREWKPWQGIHHCPCWRYEYRRRAANDEVSG